MISSYLKVSSLLFAIFVSAFLVGCSGEKTDGEIHSLSISYSEWPPDAVVYLAEEKGFFDDYGLDVNLEWVADFEETFAKVDSGEVQIWSLPLLDAVSGLQENDDWQVILVEDYSLGADAVVTLGDDISSVADLRGKKVGVEKGTLGEFFVAILLERENMTLDDFDGVEMSAIDIPAALEAGEIDAGVTYEPYITEVVSAGGTIIVDSAKERGAIVDVYLAKKGEIDENREAYIKVINGILDAQDFLNNNIEETAEILAEPLGISPEEVVESFEKLKIPDFQDNLTAFNRSSGFQALHNLARQAEEYLRDQGIVTSHKRLICVDGVFSMHGQYADIRTIAALARKYDALVYVDDAHGVGIIGERSPDELCPYGKNGNCIINHIGESYDNILLVGGLSKSFSSLVAFITCDKKIKRLLKATAVPYLYSGPAPTATLATALKGLEINEIRGDIIRASLYQKCKKLNQAINDMGFRNENTTNFPIFNFYIENPEDVDLVGEHLFEKGIYVTLAPYPLVAKEDVGFRVQITAANTNEEIDQLIQVIGEIKALIPIQKAALLA